MLDVVSRASSASNKSMPLWCGCAAVAASSPPADARPISVRLTGFVRQLIYVPFLVAAVFLPKFRATGQVDDVAKNVFNHFLPYTLAVKLKEMASKMCQCDLHDVTRDEPVQRDDLNSRDFGCTASTAHGWYENGRNCKFSRCVF